MLGEASLCLDDLFVFEALPNIVQELPSLVMRKLHHLIAEHLVHEARIIAYVSSRNAPYPAAFSSSGSA
jgi:hypothetical protein